VVWLRCGAVWVAWRGKAVTVWFGSARAGRGGQWYGSVRQARQGKAVKVRLGMATQGEAVGARYGWARFGEAWQGGQDNKKVVGCSGPSRNKT
jgi:hypothetical protein